ncbi:hypothetical protein SDAV_00733 [Spiroplasma phoeniceum P40]|uniref:Uncharacterized protein n=2 Tax=Spiroplasma phoeniceum TaxID=47835 RepID=A0A345DND2_9MOLU|nr:hypothetical protein SDAV_00733 [Spiroplasma phoeniceum P40]
MWNEIKEDLGIPNIDEIKSVQQTTAEIYAKQFLTSPTIEREKMLFLNFLSNFGKKILMFLNECNISEKNDIKDIDFSKWKVKVTIDLTTDKNIASSIQMMSKKGIEKEEIDNDLIYSEAEVKDYWIYPLLSLTGNNVKNGIRASFNKITICCTQISKGKKIRVYITEKPSFSLSELIDPTNPSEALLKNVSSLSFTMQNENLDYNSENLYLLTKEQITEDNFNTIEKYINQDTEILKENNPQTYDSLFLGKERQFALEKYSYRKELYRRSKVFWSNWILMKRF